MTFPALNVVGNVAKPSAIGAAGFRIRDVNGYLTQTFVTAAALRTM